MFTFRQHARVTRGFHAGTVGKISKRLLWGLIYYLETDYSASDGWYYRWNLRPEMKSTETVAARLRRELFDEEESVEPRPTRVLPLP